MKQKVVLVVEDDADLTSIYRNLLEHNGYRVLTAATGESALDLVLAKRGKVDLVVSDMVMDGMGGRELVWRLRETFPDIRIILVSGYATENSALQMMEERDVVFIPKPIDFELLLKTVKASLGESPDS